MIYWTGDSFVTEMAIYYLICVWLVTKKPVQTGQIQSNIFYRFFVKLPVLPLDPSPLKYASLESLKFRITQKYLTNSNSKKSKTKETTLSCISRILALFLIKSSLIYVTCVSKGKL